MKRNRDSPAAIFAVLLVVVLVSGAGIAAPGTVSPTNPATTATTPTTVDVKLTPAANSVKTGTNTTLGVVVDGATADIGAYELTVDVPFAATASIGAVEFIGSPEHTDVSVQDQGATVTLTVAGAALSGDGPTKVANLTLTGENSGTTPVRLETTSVTTKDGHKYTLGQEQDARLMVSDTVVTASPTNPTVSPDETTTVDIVATGVDSGVGAFAVNVRSTNATVATFEDVTTPGSSALQSITYGAENTSIDAVVIGRNDTENQNQTLSTLTVDTDARGVANISVSVDSLANQQGSEYILPIVRNSTLQVRETNSQPVAMDDQYTTSVGTPLSVSAPGVLTNDTDPDGDTLSASAVTRPENGSLTLLPNGSFTYTPETGFVGEDTFSYQVDDGKGKTDRATVTLLVRETGNFSTAIKSTNAPINEGERLNVTTSVKNLAPVQSTQNITLVTNGTQRDVIEVTLESSENESVVLSWSTTDGDAGTYTIRVASVTDSASRTVQVHEADGVGSPFDKPIAGGEAPPTDPDNDGLYEDVDGNGDATFDDAFALAFIQTDGLTGEQVAALDFDDDGDVDFQDAFELAFTV